MKAKENYIMFTDMLPLAVGHNLDVEGGMPSIAYGKNTASEYSRCDETRTVSEF